MLWFIYLLVFLLALVQAPILVDLVRLVFPQWRIKRLTGQASRVLLVVLMSTFFCLGLGQQVFLFIPLFPDGVANRSLKLVCHCIFAYWVWINMVVNYYSAVFVHPGTNDNSIKDKQQGLFKTDNDDDDDGKSSPPETETDLPKNGAEWISKRSHYCKVCKADIVYMDHHCPFTGNCVGLKNYSYFFLSLLYGTLGLGYAVTVVLLYFGECVLPKTWLYLDLANESDLDSQMCEEVRTHGEILFPVLGGFVVALSVLLFQVFLLLADLTTHDILKNFWKLPVLKFGLQRIKNGQFHNKDSRLRVLLLSQRSHVWHYLVPMKTDHKLKQV